VSGFRAYSVDRDPREKSHAPVTVHVNQERGEVSCSCTRWGNEFILCRHIFFVLLDSGEFGDAWALLTTVVDHFQKLISGTRWCGELMHADCSAALAGTVTDTGDKYADGEEGDDELPIAGEGEGGLTAGPSALAATVLPPAPPPSCRSCR
jgi:hypothetical protein